MLSAMHLSSKTGPERDTLLFHNSLRIRNALVANDWQRVLRTFKSIWSFANVERFSSFSGSVLFFALNHYSHARLIGFITWVGPTRKGRTDFAL